MSFSISQLGYTKASEIALNTYFNSSLNAWNSSGSIYAQLAHSWLHTCAWKR